MLYYRKTKFVSAEPLYAEIKEMMRSYFESGAVDDLLFPVWTKRALDRFEMSAYDVNTAIVSVRNGEAVLPEDFVSLREAWVCSTVTKVVPPIGGIYYQSDCRVSPRYENCCITPIPNINTDPGCSKYTVVNKVTNETLFEFKFGVMLTPGNVETKKKCSDDCFNLHQNTSFSFDIVGDRMLTNFTSGDVFMRYYSDTEDDGGNRMIPDDEAVKRYIENYILYKIFQFLSNQVTDESLNQVIGKMSYYEQRANMWCIEAETSLKRETLHETMQRIRKANSANNKYRIR